jgi:dienelactone hydrolase
VHPGYTAVPDGPGPYPGVVVVHDAYGMTAELRRVCDHLAAQGYLVHAPSMYQRGRRSRTGRTAPAGSASWGSAWAAGSLWSRQDAACSPPPP